MACPRMCRSKYKKSEMRGFLLSKINEVLGDTTDIDSVLPAVREERRQLRQIMEAEDDDDVHDAVVESWMKRLGKGKTVFFEEMYNQDVAVRAREIPVREKPDRKPDNQDVPVIEGSGNPSLNDLFELVKSMKDDMGERLNSIEEKVDGQEERVARLEGKRHKLQGHVKESSGEKKQRQGEAGKKGKAVESSKVTGESQAAETGVKRGRKRITREEAANAGAREGRVTRSKKV